MLHGDIYYIEFDTGIGHEFLGKRPALVVQSDENLEKTDVVTVVVITSNIKNFYFDDIRLPISEVNNLKMDSVIKVNHIYSIDRSRFINKIGKIDKVSLEKVKKALKKHFDL